MCELRPYLVKLCRRDKILKVGVYLIPEVLNMLFTDPT